MLLARYIFDDPDHFNKDYSGNTTGVVGGKLTKADKAAPGFGKCAHFDGGSYIQIGRKAMNTKSITVSWWGYMSNWKDYTRALSCTEGGGWNFEPGSGKMSVACYIKSKGYLYASDNTALSSLSGWHNFAFTFNNGYLKFYRDGALKQSTPTGDKTEIQYNASNSIFIGCEAGGSSASPAGYYFNGDLSDVRIYSEALSDSQIKYMYENPNSITIKKVDTSNGRLFSNGGEFIENKSISFNKDGDINCGELIEGSGANISKNGKLSFKEFVEA